MTLAGWLGTVIEDMPEMSAAASTVDLVARHPMAAVTLARDVGRIELAIETWPAGAGVELVLAGKKRQAAHHAVIRAFLLVVGQVAAEGRLGARFLGDAIGFG